MDRGLKMTTGVVLVRRVVVYSVLAGFAVLVAALSLVCGHALFGSKMVGIIGKSPVDRMDVTLVVELAGDALTVRSRFENTSDSAIHVLRGQFGYGRPGVPLDRAREIYEDEYTILRQDGSEVPYIGQHVFYVRDELGKDDFALMTPGQVVAARWDRIDRAYDFDEGTHTYQIMHEHLQFNPDTGEITRHRSRPTEFVHTRANHR